MGPSKVAQNKGQANETQAQPDIKETESLSMPKRGAVAQQIMASGSHPTSDRSEPASQPAAVYRVRAGDNPSVIAARFKVPMKELFAANPELEPTKMQPGQAVRIPGVVQEFHIIKAGDTLGKIAADLKVSVKDLQQANPKVEAKSLQIGQALFIPAFRADGTRVATQMVAQPSPQPQAPPVQALQQTGTQQPVLATPIAPKSQGVGHSAEWKPIPVDPKCLDTRFVTPLPSQPSSNFFVSVMKSLTHEAGLSTSSKDLAHQGDVKVTNFGITGMAMDSYIKKTEGYDAKPQELTARIKALTYEDALDIYASGYWQKEYKALDKKVAFLLFDWGVIGGPESTLKRVQEGLDVPKTGKIDAATVQAMKALGPEATCEKITELRIARHKEKVAQVLAATKEYDKQAKEGTLPPNKKRPIDQSGNLDGWISRAKAVNEYARSQQFDALSAAFDRTAPQGCDLMDPVRLGTVSLKKNTGEHSLVRMLQQRLTSVGYTVHQDGKFEAEMAAVVDFFQEHYRLPRQPAWGPQEMRILDALLVAKQLRDQPSLAGIQRAGR
jgi:LysM repeat protein